MTDAELCEAFWKMADLNWILLIKFNITHNFHALANTRPLNDDKIHPDNKKKMIAQIPLDKPRLKVNKHFCNILSVSWAKIYDRGGGPFMSDLTRVDNLQQKEI